jgi:hypothetical protein
MAEKLPSEPRFDLTVDCQEAPDDGADPALDATVGRFSISAADTPLTAYRTYQGREGNELVIPLYDIAEWIAVNWWALLHEPRKEDEVEDDFEFRSRHWLGCAREGFALPDVWLLPAGELMNIIAHARALRYAQLEFVNSVETAVPLAQVEETLRLFMESVLSRLKDRDVAGTVAEQAWQAIRETSSEEAVYCRLMGSLGLSPYDENSTTNRILERVEASGLSLSVIVDLCEAAYPSRLENLAALAESLVRSLPDSPEVGLSSFVDIAPPKDTKPEAWKWGLEAAKRLRETLGISPKSPDGADRFFEELGLKQEYLTSVQAGTANSVQIPASLARHNGSMHLALADNPTVQRRFAAARAAFVGWTMQSGTRLVTGAKTRQQQASRAFAAELLAPISYIRSKASKSGLTSQSLARLASDLKVSPQVLRYQARNNQIWIPDLYGSE